MRVRELKLTSFRNHTATELTFTGNRVVFYGSNGHGKTNVLEAIHVIGNGKSFRTAKLPQLVTWDASLFRVEATIERAGGSQTLALAYQEGTKHLFRNGEGVANIRDFVGALDTFVLVPQDIDLIEGGPKRRRDAVDRGIFQLRPSYLECYERYHRALSQRNALLKRHTLPPGEQFAVWEETIATEAEGLMAARMDYLERLNELLAAIPEQLPTLAETYRVTYRPSNPEEARTSAGYLELLASNRERDLNLGYTYNGPHRDEVALDVNDVPAKEHASIGQRRSFVLAYTLAALELYVERSGTYPVLLIDDLELDQRRCEVILGYLDERYPQMQIFFTTTSREKFTFPTGGEYFRVQGGEVVNDEGEARPDSLYSP